GLERTVVAPAAPSGDALGRELLDPIGELGRAGDIGKIAAAGRRHVARAVLGFQEEDRHLLARDHVGRTVVAAAAASGYAGGREGLDPRREVARAGHVRESSHAWRRDVAEAVLRLQEEDRHLLARDRAQRTVDSRAAADGDRVR